MPRRLTPTWLVAASLSFAAALPAQDSALRLNHIQTKGTHNSYHTAPALIAVPEWRYSHAPLDRQLADQGVRQVELDVHYVPDRPFSVFHVPVVDYGTTCPTLPEALATMKSWSDANPEHHALFVFVEPKDEFDRHPITGRYDELEAEILSVWPRRRILTPDDVRGDAATLRAAITEHGWPTLRATRQKIVLVMLDRGVHRDAYTRGRPALEGRLMFVTSEPGRPDAAILKIDDPVRSERAIHDAVRQGFIVRTRADAGGAEARAGSRARLQAALRSGAHLISTDFPVASPELAYWAEIPGGSPSRPNPVTAPRAATARAIEDLGKR